MPLPQAKEARPFYQSALQRFEDAEFLFADSRTTAAVYLAGYAVECILKALLLSLVAGPKRQGLLKSFRGAKAHDYEWLKSQYHGNGGPPLPARIVGPFALVSTWTTDLRYVPGQVKGKEAREFLRATEHILEWADGRL